MTVKRITPVLLAERLEAVRDFWTQRLGFTATIEVPEGDHLGFVALVQGQTEVMYQTFTSVEAEAATAPAMAAAARRGPSYLYLEVDDLEAVLAATRDLPRALPERTAFYGMREFAVQDPAGHFLTFAQRV